MAFLRSREPRMRRSERALLWLKKRTSGDARRAGRHERAVEDASVAQVVEHQRGVLSASAAMVPTMAW
jgi:hypothetical protein